MRWQPNNGIKGKFQLKCPSNEGAVMRYKKLRRPLGEMSIEKQASRIKFKNMTICKKDEGTLFLSDLKIILKSD